MISNFGDYIRLSVYLSSVGIIKTLYPNQDLQTAFQILFDTNKDALI